MKRTSIGFEATIPVMEADTLNICFKDCANNWDNNSGAKLYFRYIQIKPRLPFSPKVLKSGREDNLPAFPAFLLNFHKAK